MRQPNNSNEELDYSMESLPISMVCIKKSCFLQMINSLEVQTNDCIVVLRISICVFAMMKSVWHKESLWMQGDFRCSASLDR